MFNIWKLGNAFLQNGRSSLICCDVRYCWNQVLTIVSKNEQDLKAVDVQRSEDKQLKFKKCSNSEPSSCSDTANYLTESSLYLSALNVFNVLEAKTSDDYSNHEDNNPLLLETSDYSIGDNIDLVDPCDVNGGGIKVIRPDVCRQDHIIYSTRHSSCEDTINHPSEAKDSNLISPGGKCNDDADKSYIINIFLNNRKASDRDSINVCLKDLEIKADDICMQKLMMNIQKNYQVIDQICQSSENFEECRTRLSERLEKVWRNVFKHSSKIDTDSDSDKDKLEDKIEENETMEHGQHRVNIIVNYENAEKVLEGDKGRCATEELDIVNLSTATAQTHEKNVQATLRDEIKWNNEANQTAVLNLAEEILRNYNRNMQEENKNEKLCTLSNTIPTLAAAETDKISNEYIKRKLEMVEEKIAALAEVHEVIKDQIKNDSFKIKDDEKCLLENKETEIDECLDATASAQKNNDIQILVGNNKSTEVNFKEENEETDADCETKSINMTSEIDENQEKIEDDAITENTSNVAVSTKREAKDLHKGNDEEIPANRGLEECPAIISASACEFINKNALDTIDTQLQNRNDKSRTSPSAGQVANQVLQQNPSLLYETPPPVQDEMVLGPVSNESNKKLLEKFIIQEHINRNANRKTAKRAKENQLNPQLVCFRRDCDVNKDNVAGDNKKPNDNKPTQPRFQIKEPQCIISSVFKRTDDRLLRYNEKQQEQMNSVIKLASTPTPQSAVTKMMRFCRSFFKEDEQCLNKATKNSQQDDYIDRRMRATKLCNPDNIAFKTQYRSFMPDNALEIPPQPAKSSTEMKESKLANVGSMNRTEDIIHHQKIFQQKCGVRERMLPFSGGGSFNRSQKMSYRTNSDGVCFDNRKKSSRSIKEKIFNIFHRQKRYYSMKDDCHKDDECCEKSKSSAKDACQEDPCVKSEQCEKSETTCQPADPCIEIEEKYKGSTLKCCENLPCKPRDEDDDDDECGGPKNKCETAAEMKKIRAGVMGCTSKCLVNRDPDEALDPEPIQEPCPKKNDCDSRQDTVVEPEIPKCDIMDNIGHFIEKDGSDDVENYYGDNGYKNMEYYKNKQFTFYDINQYLANKRNSQPNPYSNNPPKKEIKRKFKRKIKKITCTC